MKELSKMWFCALILMLAMSLSTSAGAQLVGGQFVLTVGPDPKGFPDTLNFDSIVLLNSKTLSASIKNIGDDTATISGVALANNIDFSFSGNGGPYILAPDSSVGYSVTFSPKTFLPPIGKHVGNLTFLTPAGQKTIYLIGYDHIPQIDTLSVSRNYWGFAGTDIIITQELVSSLAGTLDSIYRFREAITYDRNILHFVSAQGGDLLPDPEWKVTAVAIFSPGHVTINAISNGSAIKGKGILLSMRFHIDSSAKALDSSVIGLDSSTFGNGLEPIMRVSEGLLRIMDNCTPTFLRVGGLPANSIAQNTPNPATSSTSITYYIGESESEHSPVRILLYNSLGQVLQRLVDAEQPPGVYSVTVDASSLAEGMYTYTYDCGARHVVKHLVVAR